MTKNNTLSILALAISGALLGGCGDAETNIIEKDPIVDDHDHDGGGEHDHDDLTIESAGRLAILNADANALVIVDLDDNQELDTFPLASEGNTLTHSGGYRYVVVSNRATGEVTFIDGGLWREDHVDHLHDYEQAPATSDLTLTGSRPTHLVKHDGQLAVFYDGDSDAGLPASVQVVSDTHIAAESSAIPTLAYTVNMHGVAEPMDDYLIATVRRDDAESTSANTILPDSVGVFHLHDDEYEEEVVFAGECPNLHGAASSETYSVFGCSDGVLIVHQHDGEWESSKIDNTDSLSSVRVGSVYGHHHGDYFIGVASGHGGGEATLVTIDPETNSMRDVALELGDDAVPVSYAFSYSGEYFVVLDSSGRLTALHSHGEGDAQHWDTEVSLAVTSGSAADMPDGLSFTMAVSGNSDHVYISNPIDKTMVRVDLDSGAIDGEVSLDYLAETVIWLGIAETEHE